MDIDDSTWWILAILFFIISILLTLIKESLYYVSIYKLEKVYQEKNKDEMDSWLDIYVNRREQMLWVSSSLQAFVNLGFVFLLLFWFFGPQVEVNPLRAISFFVGCFLFFLMTSLLPKMVARMRPEPILYHSLPLVYGLTKISFPLVLLFDFMERLTLRLTGMNEDSEISNAREEIMEAAREGQIYGLLEEESKKMIESIIRFIDVDASEVMVPRTDMDTLEVDTPIEEAATVAIEKGRSRIPVYKENQDNIIGILYVKDLFRYWLEKEGEGTLKEIMRKPYFVPETKWISVLLREFKAKKVHIAIVLDEYGGTAGLITIEDILEEIVGEIADEYDLEESYPSIHKISEKVLAADARVHIDEINEQLNLQLPEEEDYETLGGFVFSHLGRIPQVNEKFSYENLEFIITDADERKINRVKIIRE